VELAAYADLAVALVNTDVPHRADDDALTDVASLRDLLGHHKTWAERATADDVATLRALRRPLRAVFERAAGGDHAAAVDQLNALLQTAVIRPQISGHDAQDWHLHISEGAVDVATAYAAAALMGIAVTVSEVGLDRFGTCQAPSCDNVFIDTSTNRSRRYCSERCATRANVAAYRARRRAAS
jgi:predicted RNA-binding Zn ribbon-like protein